MGVQMFAGKFASCNIITPSGLERVSADIVPNMYVCKQMNNSYTWHNPQVNFDNVPNGYLCLFQIVSSSFLDSCFLLILISISSGNIQRMDRHYESCHRQ